MMTGLKIDAQRCRGCRRCVGACATSGIVVENRLARVTEGCVLCGACVDACPFDAISIERDEPSGMDDLGSYQGIWVVAQTDGEGALLDVSLELAGKARELADERGGAVAALLPEAAADPAAVDANARKFIAAGADAVIRCRDGRFSSCDPEVTARWITALVRERKPEIVLFGATMYGRELAPAVAIRLGTGLTADCTVLGIDPDTGLLQQTRPAFGGNLMATIVCPAHRPQMATVRPGVFPAPEPDGARTGSIEDVALATDILPRRRVISLEAAPAGESIAAAERLVVVGRGIGSKKNMPAMARLAELLGAGLGCTRPLVEAGWLEYSHQVGQTGASVAPKLLVSIGVSGAIQHLAGIGGAKHVIAVNEDPGAPIFGVADYKVVGDALEVAQAMIAELEARA